MFAIQAAMLDNFPSLCQHLIFMSIVICQISPSFIHGEGYFTFECFEK